MLSSASLFHFTRNLQSLRGILAEGFKVNPSFERMDILSRAFGGPPDGDETGIPMVCFCDIPLSQTTEHMDRYGKYAIGLSLTRFRGRLTRSKFGAEVAHEIQEEGRTSRAA